MRAAVLEILSFYQMLGRPLTTLEIWRALPAHLNKNNLDLGNLLKILDDLELDNQIVRNECFFWLATANLDVGERKKQDLLHDLKWQKLLRRAKLFSYLPFLDFVMASGSMALGNVSRESDFDVVIGVKKGRIFTARYAINLLFSIFGLRRSNDKPASSPDKFCFNHFVTETTYAKPPFNAYRRELYKNMVPLAGRGVFIKKFLEANHWSGISNLILFDERFRITKESFIKKIAEFLLGDWLGDFLENKICGPIAKRRLTRYVAKRGQIGRVVISNDELEFHFTLDYENSYTKF